MSPLASELERKKRQEQFDAFVRNETAMAESLPPVTLEPLTDAETTLLKAFVSWAHSRGVRHLPCRPTTLATWVIMEHRSTELVSDTLQALTRLHNLHSFADPVSTAHVRQAVSQIIGPVEPPRSWTKQEKAWVAQLPLHIQAAISRRDREREVQLRRLQNELAELKRKTGDAEKVADNKEMEKI